jgi:Fe-S-cluster containining protein
MRATREHIDAAAESVRRHAIEELGGRCASGNCGSVCRRVNGALEAEAESQRAAGAPIACAPSCDFCCHLRVDVFPHEAMALLDYLRTSVAATEAAAIERQILENARRIESLTVREHYAANIPCALLVAGRCSAYPVRPSACAAYHSTSRERCEHSYRHPQDIGTPKNSRPALLALQALGDALIAATQEGIDKAGLSSEQTELHQTLRALLEKPSLGANWRAGGKLAGDQPNAGDVPARESREE